MRINKKLVSALVEEDYSGKEFVDMRMIPRALGMLVALGVVCLLLFVAISYAYQSKSKIQYRQAICDEQAGSLKHYVGGSAPGDGKAYGCHIIIGAGTTNPTEKVIDL